jgi:hypothetical protein
MRLSLSSLVRMIALLGIGSTFLAVGVARSVPKAPIPVRGVEASPRYYGVNGVVFAPHKDANFLLDTETGELREFALPKNLAFDYVTCSPWRDERGDYELVGRITEHSGDSTGKLCEGWAMARIGVQSREVVNQTPVNLLVAGSPCWLAGRPARVVFPGGDGGLYLQDLGNDDESDDAGTPTDRRKVAWNAPESGIERAILNDPVRPVVPGIGGRLFVALNPGVRQGDELSFGKSQIWWITLSEDGTSIKAAGRLIAPTRNTTGAAAQEERLPNLAATPDGRIALAYLRREAGVVAWSLCVAPVTVNPKTGVPTVSEPEVRQISSDSAVTIPAFSTDGRWLYHVSRDLASGQRVPRFSVVDELARR